MIRATFTHQEMELEHVNHVHSLLVGSTQASKDFPRLGVNRTAFLRQTPFAERCLSEAEPQIGMGFVFALGPKIFW